MKELVFKNAIDQIPIPHTYMFYPEKEVPEPPYFVWYFSETDNIGADDKVYVEVLIPVIELYTRNKSFADEHKLEAVLNACGFFWQKTTEYIDSEKMYMTIYELGEICDGE